MAVRSKGRTRATPKPRQNMNRKADIAIIGAGIVGLAHALEAARRGYAVIVFERNAQALGASVRNFGMVLPLGMSAGKVHARALRSVAVWKEMVEATGMWHAPYGSLIVAYQEDEEAVLREFAERAEAYKTQWVVADEALKRCPALKTEGLRGALASPVEIVIDPREALKKLPEYLQNQYNVQFEFNTAVTSIDLPYLEAGGVQWQAKHIFVCSGSDFQTLYPEAYAASSLGRCKLQMMRTVPQPDDWQIGPMLATGLSLCHYPAFADCPSLPDLKARIARDHPDLVRWGIHVLVAQNGQGEIVLGDSHEYDDTPSPFNRTEIDHLILDYAQSFLHLPNPKIAAYWHGVYATSPTNEPCIMYPAPNVTIVNGLGGTGMTTSFGLAQETLAML